MGVSSRPWKLFPQRSIMTTVE
nr:TPA_asm: m44.7 sORF 4 [Murid betaherpesvirus 1]DBA07779.1 TPA_asm: m44.7 sORF 4 [Murid betaherpesvirus 1]